MLPDPVNEVDEDTGKVFDRNCHKCLKNGMIKAIVMLGFKNQYSKIHIALSVPQNTQ